MTQGFKKDGKFHPTGNKSKSSLKKSDVRRKRNEVTFGDFADKPFPRFDKPEEKKEKKNEFVNKQMTPIKHNLPEVKEKKNTGKKALKGIKGLVSKANDLKEQKKKMKDEEEARLIQDRLINDNKIDNIIDNPNTTSDQKFRMLQRFAVDKKDELTNLQLMHINKALMRLEKETQMPKRVQPDRDRGSSSFTPRTPIMLSSGQFRTPTPDEHAINIAREDITNPITPMKMEMMTSVPESQKLSTSGKIHDNLEAEIQATVGKR